jgi:hypothetical protein
MASTSPTATTATARTRNAQSRPGNPWRPGKVGSTRVVPVSFPFAGGSACIASLIEFCNMSRACAAWPASSAALAFSTSYGDTLLVLRLEGVVDLLHGEVHARSAGVLRQITECLLDQQVPLLRLVITMSCRGLRSGEECKQANGDDDDTPYESLGQERI